MDKRYINIGDKVTCKRPVSAYYSKYAGNPECYFNPGMIGIVVTKDIGRNSDSCCIDFYSEIQDLDIDDRNIFRCSLLFDNIIVVEKCTTPDISHDHGYKNSSIYINGRISIKEEISIIGSDYEIKLEYKSIK